MNFWRTPATTRWSFTRGAAIVRGPTPVVTGRGRAVPLRTTSACPAPSRSSRKRVTYSATSSCNAAAIMRCAPARAKSSRLVVTGVASSGASDFVVITYNIGGVPFPRVAPGPWGLTMQLPQKGTSPFSLIHNFR